MISNKKLNFWIDNNLNVLLIGEAGVGKTSIIKKAFEEKGIKWKYFSASTMDPWVDFIGVPKQIKAENGTVYLDLIRPKDFEDDTVEALFIDEFNRAPKKVRNAILELIQFKSINGKKFNNLKMVWAAINPDNDESYDVEKLDPAQLDRFHVHFEVSYKVDRKFFEDKYKEEGNGACDWWNTLPTDIKKKVSPRRLDYALEVYKLGGDVYDVLPESCNPDKLVKQLKRGDYNRILDALSSDSDKKKFFSDQNNYDEYSTLIIQDKKRISEFLPFFPEEQISKLSHEAWFKDIAAKLISYASISDVIRERIKVNVNDPFSQSIKNDIRFKPLFSEVKSLPALLNESLEKLKGNNTQIRIIGLQDLKHQLQYYTKDVLIDREALYEAISGAILTFFNRSQEKTIEDNHHLIVKTFDSIKDVLTSEDFNKFLDLNNIKIGSFYAYGYSSSVYSKYKNFWKKYSDTKNILQTF